MHEVKQLNYTEEEIIKMFGLDKIPREEIEKQYVDFRTFISDEDIKRLGHE